MARYEVRMRRNPKTDERLPGDLLIWPVQHVRVIPWKIARVGRRRGTVGDKPGVGRTRADEHAVVRVQREIFGRA